MAANRDCLAAKIRALASFVAEKAPGEFWLKGASSTSTWPYDVRLFLEPASLLVEISTKGEALYRDVASVYEDLSREVPVSLEDEGHPDEASIPKGCFIRHSLDPGAALMKYRLMQDEKTEFRLDEESGCRLYDGSIHTKVVTSYGDPVELSSTEARLLARALLRFADALDAELEIVPPAR